MSNSPSDFLPADIQTENKVDIPLALKESLQTEPPADTGEAQFFALDGSKDVSAESMNMNGNGHADAATLTPVIPQVQPILNITNKVYGSYKGTSGTFEMELRIDIDGPKPLNKISGDFVTVQGLTKTYFGSFLVDTITKTTAGGVITITGIAQTTWATAFNRVRITIPVTTIFNPLSAATLQWSNPTNGAVGASYLCSFVKRGFRTVRLEQDCTSGVMPFGSYNTGSLTSGGSARVLSVPAAYAEAGIEMSNAGIANVVPMALAGADAKWTNAELHNAMVSHFSLYQNNPAWDVWLLHAMDHINGPGLYGIMFDQSGLHRQGCAVFYRSIAGASATQQRLQLYTCVHEIGHCFNLLHSWQKSLATPAKPNIPSSLSWMNYPWGFPAGPETFWNTFPFQFDNSEIAHMRHGLRNNVIMGGNPFATGASLHDHDLQIFQENLENHSTLDLELESKRSYYLGEPVVLETKLKTHSSRNKKVISNLHADYGFVTIAIKKPGGQVLIYEPLGERCAVPEHAVLTAKRPGIYESSYIGFDKHGFIFDQVGNYELRGVYFDEDGSRIVSNTLSLRVKSPVTAQDDQVADLFMQNEVGYLMSFMGSDADYLQKGNEALELVADKYKTHPLAVYAQFAQGVNAQRTFKNINADKSMDVRRPDFEEGISLLNDVVDKSKAGKGLDNISLNQTMQIVAKAHQREGDTAAAQETVKEIVTHFNKQPIKASVKEQIAKDAASILKEE